MLSSLSVDNNFGKIHGDKIVVLENLTFEAQEIKLRKIVWNVLETWRKNVMIYKAIAEFQYKVSIQIDFNMQKADQS